MRTKGVILKDIYEFEKVSSCKKPFLCCGRSFESTPAFAFLKSSFDLTVWDNIRPNPRYEDMLAAAELFKREKCDYMIGAGGGSPLDSAKMIKLLVTNDPATALTQPMADNEIGFFAIPTTSGTGSEATKYSVFYVHETIKHSVSNDAFLPDYVLLDENFLKTVPPYQRRATCLDALSHAIESYWSVKSNDESKTYAKKAIELFVQNKEGYIANDSAANRGMLMASYYGGKAINITSTTSAHAMCYNLTMNCSTAHGHSVAVCLAEIWNYMNAHNARVNDLRGREYVLKTLDEIGILLGGRDSREGAAVFSSVLKEFELKKPVAAKPQVKEFVKSVNPAKLLSNPTVLETEDVEEIYNRVFGIHA